MSKTEQHVTVGGEALLEGIMMRGPEGAAIALRLPNGNIRNYLKPTRTPKSYCKALGWPWLRGPVSFVYSMIFGYKCMMDSATAATEDLLEDEGESGKTLMTIASVVGSVLAVGLALGLFMWLPAFLTTQIKNHVSADLTAFVALMQGVLRLVLLTGYLFALSFAKDIRRTFQYHGAEHKAIFCHEAKLPLTVQNVRRQTRFHPRCGTSFLFVMVFIGVIFSSVLNLIWPELTQHTWAQTLIKILQVPLIMSVGFEFIQFAGRHLHNPLVRLLSAPGLAMQRITTREPDSSQIEVAIAALETALGQRKECDGQPDANNHSASPAPSDPNLAADHAGRTL